MATVDQIFGRGFVLVIPIVVTLIFINLLPVSLLCFMSVSDWSSSMGLNLVEHPFIGLKNFVDLVLNQRFLQDGLTTLFWVGGAILIELPLGLTIALLLNSAKSRKLFGTEILKTVFIIPMVIAPVVVGVMWRFLFNPQVGPITQVLQTLTGHYFQVLSSRYALIGIILTDVWEYTSLFVLILYAGLQAIPRHLYDAAKVDGANAFQRIWFIEIPYIKQLISLILLMRIIDLMRWIVTILIMTGGGPGAKTEIWNVYLYDLAFRSYQIGEASALAVILVIVSVIITFLFFRFRFITA